jgi:hypothetical protein
LRRFFTVAFDRPGRESQASIISRSLRAKIKGGRRTGRLHQGRQSAVRPQSRRGIHGDAQVRVRGS